jgi:hypothetical protein
VSDNTPSPGEVWRRLDDVVRRFEEVAKDVREFRSWAERLYVPRGEWVEGRRADQLRTSDIASDVTELKQKAQSDTTWRRQVLLAFSVAAFSALVSVALMVATLMFRS